MSNPVMLYDGVCGFCNSSVQTLIKLDKKAIIKFAALQSQFGEAVKLRHPELANIDSVVLLENSNEIEKVFVRSDAILRIAHYLGGFWCITKLGYLIPRSIRDFLYDSFAKNRYKFFGKYDSCMIPSPEVRARFIEFI